MTWQAIQPVNGYEVDKAGGLRALARRLEFSASNLSQIVNGKKAINASLAEKLEEKRGLNALLLLQWQAAQDWKKYKDKKADENKKRAALERRNKGRR